MKRAAWLSFLAFIIPAFFALPAPAAAAANSPTQAVQFALGQVGEQVDPGQCLIGAFAAYGWPDAQWSEFGSHPTAYAFFQDLQRQGLTNPPSTISQAPVGAFVFEGPGKVNHGAGHVGLVSRQGADPTIVSYSGEKNSSGAWVVSNNALFAPPSDTSTTTFLAPLVGWAMPNASSTGWLPPVVTGAALPPAAPAVTWGGAAGTTVAPGSTADVTWQFTPPARPGYLGWSQAIEPVGTAAAGPAPTFTTLAGYWNLSWPGPDGVALRPGHSYQVVLTFYFGTGTATVESPTITVASSGPVISAVTVNLNGLVEIQGSGFPSQPSFEPASGSQPSPVAGDASNFAISDVGHFEEGHVRGSNANAVGVSVATWTSSSIVVGSGAAYGTNGWVFHPGDTVQVSLDGASFTTTVAPGERMGQTLTVTPVGPGQVVGAGWSRFFGNSGAGPEGSWWAWVSPGSATAWTKFFNPETDIAGNGTWYEIRAWVPVGDADSNAATYVIHHGDRTSTVVLNQSTLAGWVNLGTYHFMPGDDGYVYLNNASGQQGEMVGVDEMQFIRES